MKPKQNICETCIHNTNGNTCSGAPQKKCNYHTQMISAANSVSGKSSKIKPKSVSKGSGTTQKQPAGVNRSEVSKSLRTGVGVISTKSVSGGCGSAVLNDSVKSCVNPSEPIIKEQTIWTARKVIREAEGLTNGQAYQEFLDLEFIELETHKQIVKEIFKEIENKGCQVYLDTELRLIIKKEDFEKIKQRCVK